MNEQQHLREIMGQAGSVSFKKKSNNEIDTCVDSFVHSLQKHCLSKHVANQVIVITLVFLTVCSFWVCFGGGGGALLIVVR
jgi:hypothetical protein